MAKQPSDSSDPDFVASTNGMFASETELLRSANMLPKLSSQLRDRVLNAASVGFRRARRWAQAQQAASFLSVCLMASFVLSPLAKIEWPHPAEIANHIRQWSSRTTFAQTSLAQRDLLSRGESLPTPTSTPTPTSSGSLWTLSHDSVFLDLPAKSPAKPRTRQLTTIARAEPTLSSDALVAAFQSSDGWEAVQAFEAVRSRSRHTIQRALAAN
jgi:hypothetical protein